MGVNILLKKWKIHLDKWRGWRRHWIAEGFKCRDKGLKA